MVSRLRPSPKGQGGDLVLAAGRTSGCALAVCMQGCADGIILGKSWDWSFTRILGKGEYVMKRGSI